MKIFKWARATGLALAISTGAAMALPVTWGYEITFDSIDVDGAGLFSNNSIAAGSTVSGTIVYDDTATNLSTNSGSFDQWNVSSATTGVPFGPAFEDGIIQALDDPANDSWTAILGFGLPIPTSGTLTPGLRLAIIMTLLGDFGYNQGSAIDVGPGLGHPVLAPPVVTFTEALAAVQYFDVDQSGNLRQGTATGSVRIFTPTPQVPLPASLPLLAGGLLALGWLGRRRHSGHTLRPSTPVSATRPRRLAS